MASVVDICNLALAHIGDSANISAISPPDGSSQADHCSRFYPVARDALLEMHAWNFATKRDTLALLTTDTPANWLYRYARPSNCARVLKVLPPEPVDDDTDSQPFVEELDSTGARTILTNQEDAYVQYTALVTDTTKFSPLFTTALSYLLASYLAGPVVKDLKLKQGMYQLARAELGLAAPADANARKSDPRTNYQAPWISAR